VTLGRRPSGCRRKNFLTASVEARVARRARSWKRRRGRGGHRLAEEIEERDRLDRSRPVSPWWRHRRRTSSIQQPHGAASRDEIERYRQRAARKRGAALRQLKAIVTDPRAYSGAPARPASKTCRARPAHHACNHISYLDPPSWGRRSPAHQLYGEGGAVRNSRARPLIRAVGRTRGPEGSAKAAIKRSVEVLRGAASSASFPRAPGTPAETPSPAREPRCSRR